jgi:hypothetical protein
MVFLAVAPHQFVSFIEEQISATPPIARFLLVACVFVAFFLILTIGQGPTQSAETPSSDPEACTYPNNSSSPTYVQSQKESSLNPFQHQTPRYRRPKWDIPPPSKTATIKPRITSAAKKAEPGTIGFLKWIKLAALSGWSIRSQYKIRIDRHLPSDSKNYQNDAWHFAAKMLKRISSVPYNGELPVTIEMRIVSPDKIYSLFVRIRDYYNTKIKAAEQTREWITSGKRLDVKDINLRVPETVEIIES